MPSNSLRDLGGTAQAILKAFEKELLAAGVEVPDVRFVSPGSEIAWDGEQLCVNLVDVQQGTPDQPVSSTMYPTTTIFAAQFAVLLLREVPVLSEDTRFEDMLPTPQEAEKAAINTMDDIAGLAIAATEVHKQYAIAGPGEGFVIGAIQSFGPEGGLVGSRCPVTVSVN